MRGVMIRFKSIVLILTLLVLAGSAFAFPFYLEDFKRDPLRRAEADGCGVCHVSEGGGGERNEFGQAYETDHKITAMMRAQFPDRFAYPTVKSGNDLVIHFSDPENKQVVVESGGTKTLIDVAGRTVNGSPASPAAAAGSSQ